MKLKKSELYFIISILYCFIIFFGNDYLFSFIKDFENIKNYLVVIFPMIFIIYFVFKIFREKKLCQIVKENKTLVIVSTLLLLISIISIVFGIKISLTNIKGIINLMIIIAIINIVNFIDFSNEDSNLIKKHILIIFCATSIFAIFQYLIGFGLSTGGMEKYNIKGRVTSTFYISTLYDKYIILNIIYILYLLLKEDKKIYYVILFIGIIAFGLTFSRSSFIILTLVAVLFIVFSIITKKYKKLWILPVSLFLLFCINGYPLVIQSSVNYIYDKIKVPSNLRIEFINFIYKKDSCFYKFYEFQNELLNIWDNDFENLDSNDSENDFENINNGSNTDNKNGLDNMNSNNLNNGHESNPENMPNNNIEQIEDINSDKSLDSRAYFENVGKAVIKEHKLTGIGIGNYYYLYKNQNVNDYLINKIDTGKLYMYPHNNYIHVAAEIGIPGIILFIVLVILPILIKFRNKNEYIFLMLSLIALFLLTGLTESIMHAKHFVYVYLMIQMLIISIDNPKTSKKKMIIYLPKLIYGGMEKSLINFIKYGKYNKVYDLYLNVGYVVNKEMLDLIPKDVHLKIYCKGKWNILSKFTTFVKMGIEWICNIVSNRPYDYAISYAYQHYILATLARSASYNNYIFIHSDLKLSRTQKQINKLNKLCKYYKFDNIICVSNAARESFIETTNIRKDKVYTINNFINGNEIIEKSKEYVNDKFDFVVVARLDEKSKRISRVLEASKILKDKGYKFSVGIIGDGESYKDYDEYIKNNNLCDFVKLLGLKSNPYPYIKGSKSLVISSEYEGYSLSFLEAKILSTYIISTDVGDTKQDLPKENGVVVEKNANSIAKAMENVLNMKKLDIEPFDYNEFNKEQKDKYDLLFKDKQKVMFISSVGGHLTQLLELKKIFNNYNYVLVTEKTDVTKPMKDKYNIEYLPYGSRNQKLRYIFVLLWSCIKSLYYFIKYNPDVIVTTGANTAAAMCCLGKLFGKKVIYIESFAKRTSPTVTGKYIYKLHAYTTFVVQWESMLEFYPNAEYWGWIY